MPRARDLLGVAALAAALATPAGAEPARTPAEPGPLFDTFSLDRRKDPIIINADTLEYDYKTNVVVYRGEVIATQGPVKLRSDTLTVTLKRDSDGGPPAAAPAPGAQPAEGTQRVQQVVAVGKVRIDQGTRWATGGRAVFDQGTRTVVLSETPVLHDGANEVAGERVVVFLDEDRSVVEGGRRRVKAVLHPGTEDASPAEQSAAAGTGAP